MKIDLLLQPKQLDLLRLIEAKGPNCATWLGFGGARGGGKSGAARRLMVARRLTHPRTTGFIVRRNFPDLYENHIIKFQAEFPEFHYEAGHKQYLLPNGSRIAFRYADTENEVRQISRGPEAMDVFVDQAEQFNSQELLWLHTPNRWPGAGPGACKTVLFFNPGGVGTEYLRRVFWLRQFKEGETAEQFAFIQAYGWDNFEWFRGEVALTEREFYSLPDGERFHLFITATSYGKTLNALPPSMRVGELMGSFDKFSGQYFEGVWDEEKCVLPIGLVNQIIQPWWVCWCAQDWGFGDHAAHLWCATGRLSPLESQKYLNIDTEWPIEVVIVYRELIAQGMAEGDLAMRIVERTHEKIARFFLSPDACARKSAHTVAEEMSKILVRGGLPPAEPADNERVAGWRFLYNAFRQTSGLVGARADKERAKQGPLLLVSAECVNLISCIPLAVRDEDDPNDVAKASTLWEDVTDSLRYLVVSMLGPKARAPASVRAVEVYNSVVDPTAKVIAMKKFELAEQQRGRRRGNFR